MKNKISKLALRLSFLIFFIFGLFSVLAEQGIALSLAPIYVCGNNICEEGEAGWCPACHNSNPPCEAPCTVGTCPQDCNSVNKCIIRNIDFAIVPGFVYYKMYIDTFGLPSHEIYGITGADSWNNLQFKDYATTGNQRTLESTQTLNSQAVSYITERKNNIQLTYNGSVLGCIKSECNIDSDCVQVDCFTTPCPQNKCINGKCTTTYCGNGVCDNGEAGYCPPAGEGPCTSGTCPQDCKSTPQCGDGICDEVEKTKCRPCNLLYPPDPNCPCKSCPQDCSKDDLINVQVPSTFSLNVGQRAKVVNYFEMKLMQVSKNEKNFCCGGFNENTGTTSYFWSDDKYCGYEGMSCAGSCPSLVDTRFCIPTKKQCTAEAKICPDGTSVGRTGPNCEFPRCPGESISVGEKKSVEPAIATTTPLRPNSRSFAVIEVIWDYKPAPLGGNPNDKEESVSSSTDARQSVPSSPPIRSQQLTIFEGESREISGTSLSLSYINGDTATFKISFVNEFGCDVNLCKKFLCCSGTKCPGGLPRQCESCKKDICSATCGNGKCEEGEAGWCPPCKSEPCPAMPCTSGTCPQDCEATTIERPICDKIGTKVEGWYINGKLLRYDKCTCTAVCKRTLGVSTGGASGSISQTIPGETVGVNPKTQEGSGISENIQGDDETRAPTAYFSSCNGDLIEYADCNPEINSGSTLAVTIEQGRNGGMTVVKSEQTTATTRETVVVENQKLKVSTENGAKDIHPPEQASQKAMSAGISQVSSIELKRDGDKVYYEVDGKQKSYFLWFIPIMKQASIKVDAQTNEIVR